MLETQVDPQPYVSARGFEGREHQLALPRAYDVVVAAVEKPNRRSAQRVGVLGG